MTTFIESRVPDARPKPAAGLRDARGLAVTAHSARALDHFEQGLEKMISYRGDAMADVQAALEADPQFIMAHVLRANLLLTAVERRFVPEALASLQAAEAAAVKVKANSRERAHIAASRLCAQGRWEEARAAWAAITHDHPLDVLALLCGHLFDFACGDKHMLRDRVGHALPAWSSDDALYSYVLGLYAFGLEECGQYEAASSMAERALQIEPRDAWAVHAAVHVMEMQGRTQEGIAFLAGRQADWASDNGFAYHNWWHMALFHLELGDTHSALELWDTRIANPQPDLSLQLLDATAMLWRLRLQGADTGERFACMAALWQQRAEVETGFYAFNDFHAALAYIGAGDVPAAERLLREMPLRVPGDARASNVMMTAEVGEPLVAAMVDLAKGLPAHAVQMLEPLQQTAHRFGGSHAQRDIIMQTLLAAAIASGDTAVAKRLAVNRLMSKPDSPLAQLWARRVAAMPPARR
jgi:tetratricopeptide (TPR) repeat protein